MSNVESVLSLLVLAFLCLCGLFAWQVVTWSIAYWRLRKSIKYAKRYDSAKRLYEIFEPFTESPEELMGKVDHALDEFWLVPKVKGVYDE